MVQMHAASSGDFKSGNEAIFSGNLFYWANGDREVNECVYSNRFMTQNTCLNSNEYE